jgi:hypothetical protein
MTSRSPRIYTYKITFEEVPYYYYGVHKEKKFDEYYMGSPYTNKWCWEFYTPKKQILQFFDFTDEGWIESQEVEKQLIKPFYNTDKWCLNENCGGNFSLKISRETGEKYKKLGIGVCGMTYEQRKANGLKSSKWQKENNKGVKINLNPGDMLIYKGNEIEHWREPFDGEICTQVFLHYNNIATEGSKDNIFDKRPHLGLPAYFKK